MQEVLILVCVLKHLVIHESSSGLAKLLRPFSVFVSAFGAASADSVRSVSRSTVTAGVRLHEADVNFRDDE